MLRKITELKNVGKFINYQGSNHSLKKFTGIFANNGMGKTTIAAILHSLAEENPSLVSGRRRLGSPNKPSVRIETDSGFLKFSDDNWDNYVSNLEVFDTRFVNLNVFP